MFVRLVRHGHYGINLVVRKGGDLPYFVKGAALVVFNWPCPGFSGSTKKGSAEVIDRTFEVFTIKSVSVSGVEHIAVRVVHDLEADLAAEVVHNSSIVYRPLKVFPYKDRMNVLGLPKDSAG